MQEVTDPMAEQQRQGWTIDSAILAIAVGGGSGEFATADSDRESNAAETWLRDQFTNHDRLVQALKRIAAEAPGRTAAAIARAALDALKEKP